MKLTVEGLEKERDFYFGKLRDIELICQENENENPVVSRIIKILYATEVNNTSTLTTLTFESVYQCIELHAIFLYVKLFSLFI